jgi:hypothetical protein
MQTHIILCEVWAEARETVRGLNKTTEHDWLLNLLSRAERTIAKK